MRNVLVLIMLVFIAPFTYASEQCISLFTTSTQVVSFELNQIRPLVFTNTEVHRRNNDIGQQQVGELKLEKWFELPPYDQGFYNFVGLTSDGKVFHIVDWEGRRRIARLLSGPRDFSQLVLVNSEILLALDAKGQVFMYSADLWRKSPKNKIVKQALQIQGGLFATLTSIFYLVAPQSFDVQFLPLIIGTTGLMSSMQAGFWALFKYEKLNTTPDGFRELPLRVKDMDDLAVHAGYLLQASQSAIPLATDMQPIPETSIPTPLKEATEEIR